MASQYWTFLLVLVVATRGQTAAINKRPVTAIQPISCAAKSGEVGVCMFAWHCLLFKGKHLTTCYDGIFVGSCCQLPPASTPGPSNEVLPVEPGLPRPDPTSRPESTSTPASASLDWRPVTSTSVVTSIPQQGLPDTEKNTVPSVDPTTVTTLPAGDTSDAVTDYNLPTEEPITDSQLVTSDSTQGTGEPDVIETPQKPIHEAGGSDPTISPSSTVTVEISQPVSTTVEVSQPVSTTTESALPTETEVSNSTVFVGAGVTTSTTETPTTTRRPAGNSTATWKPVTVPDAKPIPVPPTTIPTPEVQQELSTIPPNKTGDFLQDYKEVCGKPLYGPQGRIVGGNNAHYLEWPWMISLRQWKKNNFLHKCGAALLNGQWAITAAHCVESVPASDILLRMGEYDISSEKEPESYEERRVQIVASHHKFDPRTFEYDLALLRFYQPVRFRRNILPICIPQDNEDFVGKTATVTGWGRLYEDGPLPSVMQKVKVPVITNRECEEMYKKAGFIEDIPDIFICAGKAEGGRDSCEGDSGGPMVLKNSEGRWVLAGIISWGIGCALPNQPGVYTRITKFANWIESIIVH